MFFPQYLKSPYSSQVGQDQIFAVGEFKLDVSVEFIALMDIFKVFETSIRIQDLNWAHNLEEEIARVHISRVHEVHGSLSYEHLHFVGH